MSRNGRPVVTVIISSEPCGCYQLFPTPHPIQQNTCIPILLGHNIYIYIITISCTSYIKLIQVLFPLSHLYHWHQSSKFYQSVYIQLCSHFISSIPAYSCGWKNARATPSIEISRNGTSTGRTSLGDFRPAWEGAENGKLLLDDTSIMNLSIYDFNRIYLSTNWI